MSSKWLSPDHQQLKEACSSVSSGDVIVLKVEGVGPAEREPETTDAHDSTENLIHKDVIFSLGQMAVLYCRNISAPEEEVFRSCA